MKQLTQIGATTQEAISLALQKLGKTREQVDVEVLQEGKKGFLGFGARSAQVRVTVKEVQIPIVETEKAEQQNLTQLNEQIIDDVETISSQVSEQPSEIEAVQQVKEDPEEEEASVNPIDEAKAYLVNIARQLDIHDLDIETTREGKYVLFQLKCEKAALLIGKRGQTLNSLQQLTQLVLNKSAKQFLMVKLDVENYRERRQEALELLADRMADKALRLNQRVAFEPMQSYERKIIHNQLANRLDIETYSEGTEPNRYLVIEPVKNG
ncbi:RNA-binding cell elongation regulator Jag/EloR [Lysinibacillus pakistanensis]|uniref:RNA-binding protein KhpB n=1 Tax=Lysinibacillus pakistanensis TaxID=759811 RepID=A0AAX3WVJ4_9BACI|nr:RNA-binding cell elongation regulator Jag/EloR [Lysinibacillus pakistanensis]MDM5231118.1 RNA-binding cell elongation regulator Jag/EloR [Lysinibacillus pakistanensis]WHY46677.1 RNA-binding cell elongation regulator Jag/EloR [Lysinibacillus pakistanensis]WHY51690.1 RNA-binding cell elongation regulator Jag/EloR [Lysinibacillus pakistanensis]